MSPAFTGRFFLPLVPPGNPITPWYLYICSLHLCFYFCFANSIIYTIFFWISQIHVNIRYLGEGNGTPLQYSYLENPMNGGAWWAAVHGIAKSQTGLSDFTFTFHFPTLEKEMATHSNVLAWRIPGMAEPGGLPSMGLHRVGHDWSDLAYTILVFLFLTCFTLYDTL